MNCFIDQHFGTDEPMLGGAGGMPYLAERSKEQALKQIKEQTNCNPGARSTKNAKKEHGVEKNSKKEHGTRKNPGAKIKIKKKQGAV